METELAPRPGTNVDKDRAPGYYFPRAVLRYEEPYKHLILKWWTEQHDDLLRREVLEQQWSWRPSHQTIVAITPPKNIEEFRTEPTGLEKLVTRSPTWKRCAACSELFHETSAYLFALGGIEQLNICSPCIRGSVFGKPVERMSKARVQEYLQTLAYSLGRVPKQDFGNRDMRCLWGLSTAERALVVRLLRRRPSLGQVKEHFGTWLRALADSGVLPDGGRRTARGTQCIATDGHACLSLAEKTIDDLLTVQGLEHERETFYPKSNCRFDFVVGDLHIEYFGLMGDMRYEAKVKAKLATCGALGLKLLPVYPKDLLDLDRLAHSIKRLVNRRTATKIAT